MQIGFFAQIVNGLVRGAIFCALAGMALSGSAQADEPTHKNAKLPASGELSRSINSGYTSQLDYSMPWAKRDTKSSGIDQTSPITGSVSRISNREWRMRVFNNSKETYSVDLRVVQRNINGRVLKTDSFSYVIKGGESKERSVSATDDTKDTGLELVSWRNLSAVEHKSDASSSSVMSASAGSKPGNNNAPAR